jgi:predicted hydrocarbon binding protein
MMEAIFARAAGRPVKVELLRTIARGDGACEFRIALGQP